MTTVISAIREPVPGLRCSCYDQEVSPAIRVKNKSGKFEFVLKENQDK